MKTTNSKTHPSTETASTNDHATKETKTMTTHAHKSNAAATHTTSASAAAPATSTPTSTPATTASLTPPPPDAHSPSPPAGFEPPTGANFRGVLPRGTELAAAGPALKDLARFAATYLAVLGATAPPLDHLIAALTGASGWSTLRGESSAWDTYCATEEGLAWQAARPLLDKLTTAFQLASDSNKSLASEYPGLATLLGSKSTIAQKGASTKRLNKKAVAEGKPPYHGAVGKKRQRKAEKAAAGAQSAQPTTTAPAAATAAPPAGTAGQGGGH